MKKIKRVFKFYFILAGISTHVFVFWMGMGLPLGFDKWLEISHQPEEAEAIICLGGGLVENNFPAERGLQRIYTAVQLYMDKWAPKVVFSGGGPNSVSEGEVYAEVAAWLGLPEEASLVDPHPGSTAEHPESLLKMKEVEISRDTPLIVVTSPFHSKRSWLCFKKAGFTNFRMVTGYTAHVDDQSIVRTLKESKFEEYKPSQKKQSDFLFRLKIRSNYFWDVVREYAAIAWYRLTGEV